MIWLKYIVLLLLWTCCNSQNVCEEPPEVDFGETVSGEKTEYRNGDRVQYRCFLGYALEGPEWITCKGPEWTPAPKCLAPCIITKQQLEAKNLFLSARQRHSLAIGNNQTLEFLCKEGYVLSAPSIKRCIDGHMDLPSCISERGKNCSRSPTIENGDITTLSQEQYTSGSSVEFKCQRHYAMEGHSRSFCDNGNWTKVPVCLEPCVISLAEIERHNISVKLRSNEDEFQTMYLPHGDSIEFHCKSGHVLATNPSKSVFEFQCRGGPFVYPECKEIPTCESDPPLNGFFTDQKDQFALNEGTKYRCQIGFTTQEGLKEGETRCLREGWTPKPKCVQACTVSEEDMARNNIQLKWKNAPKLYSESGDVVEFVCRRNYWPAQPSPPFRTRCINGRVEYPRCVYDK